MDETRPQLEHETRQPAGAGIGLPRRNGWPYPLRPVAAGANRSAARAFTRAFRGINGCLPALASHGRAPSIYSTVHWRPRWIAALSVSHGDRRMRGRQQLNTAPHAEGSTANSGSLGNWGRAVEPGGHRRAESTRHRSGRSRTTVLTNRCDVVCIRFAPVARSAAVMVCRQCLAKSLQSTEKSS